MRKLLQHHFIRRSNTTAVAAFSFDKAAAQQAHSSLHLVQRVHKVAVQQHLQDTTIGRKAIGMRSAGRRAGAPFHQPALAAPPSSHLPPQVLAL